MVAIYTPSFFQPSTVNGVPLAGAKLFFYQTGTTTLITVYQDSALGTPHANPVVADASGIFAPIYVSDATFKTVLKTSADVTVQTVDPVYMARLAIATTDNTVLRADGTTGGIQGSSLIVSDAGDVTLESTDAGAAAGPILTLNRNSASPAASDIIGKVLFQGEDSAGNTEDYAEIYTQITDTTATSEDANVLFRNKVAGTMTTQLTLTNAGATFAGGIIATTGAFSDAVTISSALSASNELEIISTNADALAGPGISLYRNSASPLAGDVIGILNFNGKDSAGNKQQYFRIYTIVDDPTGASEDGRLILEAMVAGSASAAMQVRDGVIVGSPTGSFKGVGTLNAVAVYDDNVLLTDYVFDYAMDGAVREEDGEIAQAFAARGWLLDIERFSSEWKASRHLPSMPSRDEWEANGSQSVGALIQKLWETVEVQAVHISALNDRLKAVEAA